MLLFQIRSTCVIHIRGSAAMLPWGIANRRFSLRREFIREFFPVEKIAVTKPA
jgi:hypothetical protein